MPADEPPAAGRGSNPNLHAGDAGNGEQGTPAAPPQPEHGQTDGAVPADGSTADLPRTEGIVEDPVEILVGLAERGEIDPWNIDIIEVTDRFLNELERRRELNLQLSGRTLFYAATLVRLKSEQLVVVEVPEDEGDGDGDADDLFGDDFGGGLSGDTDYGGRLGPIERLEHEIQRRLDRKNMRKSPITLFELITELKNIEKEERTTTKNGSGTGPRHS